VVLVVTAVHRWITGQLAQTRRAIGLVLNADALLAGQRFGG
jgi:hypothetical protein